MHLITGSSLPPDAIGALRMGALQSLKTITIATHDSIGVGEDGPTHQPIGLSNFFRSLPNCRLYRPADMEEAMGAWLDAVGDCRGPAIMCLTRQPVSRSLTSYENRFFAFS